MSSLTMLPALTMFGRRALFTGRATLPGLLTRRPIHAATSLYAADAFCPVSRSHLHSAAVASRLTPRRQIQVSDAAGAAGTAAGAAAAAVASVIGVATALTLANDADVVACEGKARQERIVLEILVCLFVCVPFLLLPLLGKPLCSRLAFSRFCVSCPAVCSCHSSDFVWAD